MHFGCWNVQGLTNKIQKILFELTKLNIDVAVLFETNRWRKGMST
jgi:hypothetical protein